MIFSHTTSQNVKILLSNCWKVKYFSTLLGNYLFPPFPEAQKCWNVSYMLLKKKHWDICVKPLGNSYSEPIMPICCIKKLINYKNHIFPNALLVYKESRKRKSHKAKIVMMINQKIWSWKSSGDKYQHREFVRTGNHGTESLCKDHGAKLTEENNFEGWKLLGQRQALLSPLPKKQPEEGMTPQLSSAAKRARHHLPSLGFRGEIRKTIS